MGAGTVAGLLVVALLLLLALASVAGFFGMLCGDVPGLCRSEVFRELARLLVSMILLLALGVWIGAAIWAAARLLVRVREKW